MLILGYADWCPHCKNFKPIWAEFKKKYGKVLDIREVRSEDDKNGTLKQLGIRGFPTVILLHNGKRHEFNGPRTVEGLEKFVKGVVNHHLKDDLNAYRAA